MSYSNVGLSTPRGSGTSGYVQSNKFRPRSAPSTSSSSSSSSINKAAETKKTLAKDVAEHERKRRIESELLLLSETLADQGYGEAEIDEKVREARAALAAGPAAREPAAAKRF